MYTIYCCVYDFGISLFPLFGHPLAIVAYRHSLPNTLAILHHYISLWLFLLSFSSTFCRWVVSFCRSVYGLLAANVLLERWWWWWRRLGFGCPTFDLDFRTKHTICQQLIFVTTSRSENSFGSQNHAMLRLYCANIAAAAAVSAASTHMTFRLFFFLSSHMQYTYTQ